MLTRMVNGISEVIPPAEEARIRAEWAANLAARPTEAQRVDAEKERRLNETTMDSLIDVIANELGKPKSTMRTLIKAKMRI